MYERMEGNKAECFLDKERELQKPQLMTQHRFKPCISRMQSNSYNYCTLLSALVKLQYRIVFRSLQLCFRRIKNLVTREHKIPIAISRDKTSRFTRVVNLYLFNSNKKGAKYDVACFTGTKSIPRFPN